MPPASTVEKRTHCPNCGVKLPEQPLSLCAYCAMPIDLAGGSERKETQNTARIQKVEAHDGYGEAQAFEPPESGEWQRGWRLGYRGRVLIALGLLALIPNVLLGSGSYLARPWTWLTVVLLGLGVSCLLRGGALRAAEVAKPLLKRAALITDRRSDTTIRGWGGATRYFFTIEFADGNVAEFDMSGRGVNEEPYATNLPGVAYTRGERLLFFKHIRV